MKTKAPASQILFINEQTISLRSKQLSQSVHLILELKPREGAPAWPPPGSSPSWCLRTPPSTNRCCCCRTHRWNMLHMYGDIDSRCKPCMDSFALGTIDGGMQLENNTGYLTIYKVPLGCYTLPMTSFGKRGAYLNCCSQGHTTQMPVVRRLNQLLVHIM